MQNTTGEIYIVISKLGKLYFTNQRREKRTVEGWGGITRSLVFLVLEAELFLIVKDSVGR